MLSAEGAHRLIFETHTALAIEAVEHESRMAKAWSFVAFVMALAALLIAGAGCSCASGDIEWPEVMTYIVIAICWTVYRVLVRVQNHRIVVTKDPRS